MSTALLVVIVILVLFVADRAYAYRMQQIDSLSSSAEKYRSCRDCDDSLRPGGAVLNPFVYPYSATACVDNVYRNIRITDANVAADIAPLNESSFTETSTPDHFVLTN